MPLAHAEAPTALPGDALPVPSVGQTTSYSCGDAALVAVLEYWQVFDGRTDLYRALHTSERDGTEPEPMARLARGRGLEASYRHDLTVEELRAATARGDTVILDLQAWPEAAGGKKKDLAAWSADWADGHYVVLIALDEHNAYAMDPSAEGGLAWLPLAELEARWHDEEQVGKRLLRRQHMAILVHGTHHVGRGLERLE